MNIGILTYHSVPNFGAQLQALSTVWYIRNHGHTPVILNWYPKDLENMYEKRVGVEQINAHNNFMETYLPITKICRDEKELIDVIVAENIESILVGSDALFKYTPILKRVALDRKHLKIKKVETLSCERLEGNPFFGHFLSSLPTDIKAASFSVSSQNCPFRTMFPWEKSKMRKALANYSYISVRDSWTKQMVENILQIGEVEITPDPVFSFNQNCGNIVPSKEEIIKRYELPSNYVLLSFGKHYATKSYIDNIVQELKHANLTPVWLPMPEGGEPTALTDNKIPLPLNPLDWYALIKYAKGYIGERMHPIVVSLHNSVPFYCFDEYGIKTFVGRGFRRRYNQETSKTFLIVKRAGFIDNLSSYHTSNTLPPASVVVKRILDFDEEKCSNFSKEYQREYECCMENVLSAIIC